MNAGITFHNSRSERSNLFLLGLCLKPTRVACDATRPFSQMGRRQLFLYPSTRCLSMPVFQLENSPRSVIEIWPIVVTMPTCSGSTAWDHIPRHASTQLITWQWKRTAVGQSLLNANQWPLTLNFNPTQKLKLKSQSVQKIRVETDGPYPANAVVKNPTLLRWVE